VVKKIRQKIKKLRERGFTLVELLLVTGIMGILSTAVIMNGLGYRNRQALDLAAQQVVANIRDACDRARTQQDGLPWGIYFNNTTTDQYTVFSGATYASSASYTRIPTTLDSPITFTSPASGSTTEIRFAQVTCRPHATGTISIYNNSDARVISIDSNGRVTISDPSAPNQVTGLTATFGDSQIALSWAEPSHNGLAISSYKIYRGLSPGSEVLFTTATSTSYTNTGLTNGTTYYYQVSAVNSSGEGALSAETSSTPYVSSARIWLVQTLATTSGAYAGDRSVPSITVDSDIYIANFEAAATSTNYYWRVEKRSFGDGSQLWVATSNPTTVGDIPYALTGDSSYIYIGGNATTTNGYLEARLKSTGGLVWSSSTGSSAEIYSMEADGYDLFAVGYPWTVKKISSTDGALTWATSTNSTPGVELAYGVVTDASYLYVVGLQNGDGALGGTVDNWRLEKRSRSDGTLTWAVTQPAPTSTEGFLYGIADDTDYLYVVGLESSAHGLVQKRNKSDGSLVWAATTSFNNVDEIYSVALDDTYVYTAGYDNPSIGNYQWRLEKRLQSTGAVVWTTTTWPGGNSRGTDIFLSNGFLYIAGNGQASGGSDYHIEKRAR
jgi:prepilin-type N-terminal cleavage/methylation domain-containing protein